MKISTKSQSVSRKLFKMLISPFKILIALFHQNYLYVLFMYIKEKTIDK